MIILDETNDVAKSGVPPEPLSPSEQSPPPPPYSSQPTDPLLPRSAYSARKRFLNAFLLACLAALLAAGLLGSAVVSWRIRRGAVPPTVSLRCSRHLHIVLNSFAPLDPYSASKDT